MSDNPEARCDSKCHGILVAPGIWEVKCSSRYCGARPGEVVVLHRFRTKDMVLLETKRFRELHPARIEVKK